MHTIYAYEREFNFTPGDTLIALAVTDDALSSGADEDVHTYQLAALTWNVLSDPQLWEIVIWKTDEDGDPLKYRVRAKKREDEEYFITMSCGEDEATCVTDSSFSLEGKRHFWDIISDACPLAAFKMWFT